MYSDKRDYLPAPDINRAKTHCPAWHEYTPDNTYVHTDPKTGRVARHCRKCMAAANRRYEAKQREKGARRGA